tara:strand:+ start:458 stop:1384 length:927 start_codon:yes stop_codon:yes gene_type:complete
MFINDNRAWLNIEIACNLLDVSKSSYYDWVGNQVAYKAKAEKSQELSAKVVEEFIIAKCRYGSIRLSQRLAKQNITCNPKAIAKILKLNNLRPVGYKRYKVRTTNSNHKLRIFPNLLERNFKVNAPNMVWVSDITYIPTDEGWLYLATVIDLFSRKLIGYTMSRRMTKDLVISALSKALTARGNPKNVIVHSDRGSQYASNEYKKLLKQYGLLGSMSKKGDCWDNAVAESFFATIKKEYIYQTHFKTRQEAELGVFDYVETWYNKERIHSLLNGLSPDEFEMLNKDKFSVKNKTKNTSKNGTIEARIF